MAVLLLSLAGQTVALGQGSDPDLLPPEVILSTPGAQALPAGLPQSVSGRPAAMQSLPAARSGLPQQGLPSPGIQAFMPSGWPFDGQPPPGGMPDNRDYASFYRQLLMDKTMSANPLAGGAQGAVPVPSSQSLPDSSTQVEAAASAGPFSGVNDKDCPLCKKKAAEAAAREAALKQVQSTQQNPDAVRPDPLAIVETSKGTITIRLFRQYAPKTVANFIDLAQKGFYNGLTWHRVVPGFVIQTGCPKGDGTGGYIDPQSGKARTLPLELHQRLQHNSPGVVAMARFGADLNSASSQFYITLAPLPKLDNKYTVFGGVVSGMDAVMKITPQDRIIGISMQGI